MVGVEKDLDATNRDLDCNLLMEVIMVGVFAAIQKNRLEREEMRISGRKRCVDDDGM